MKFYWNRLCGINVNKNNIGSCMLNVLTLLNNTYTHIIAPVMVYKCNICLIDQMNGCWYANYFLLNGDGKKHSEKCWSNIVNSNLFASLNVLWITHFIFFSSIPFVFFLFLFCLLVCCLSFVCIFWNVLYGIRVCGEFPMNRLDCGMKGRLVMAL